MAVAEMTLDREHRFSRSTLRSKLERASVLLAIVGPSLVKLYDPLIFPNMVQHRSILGLLPLAPALLMGGTFVFSNYRQLFSGWLLLCAAMAVIGTGWSLEPRRGMTTAFYILTSFPIAGLLIKHNFFKQSAFVHIVFVGLLAVFAGSGFEGLGVSGWNFGTQWTMEVRRTFNPNQFAFQLGFGALLLFQMYQGAWSGKSPPRATLSFRSYALLAGFLVMLGYIFVTGSRGGLFSLVAAVMFCRNRTSQPLLFKLLVIAAAGMLVFQFAGYTGQPLGGDLSERYVRGLQGDTSGRVDIWAAGLEAFTRDEWRMLIGFGTGGVHSAIGEHYAFAKATVSGVYRTASHNTFLEWLMSYGIIGAMLSIPAIIGILRRAFTRDVNSRVRWRLSLLVLLALFGMSGVVYTGPSWPFIGAWLWASLWLPPDTEDWQGCADRREV